MTEDQADRLISSIDEVSASIDNNKLSFEVDDYNMLSYIAEALNDINSTLKKIEAKMQ